MSNKCRLKRFSLFRLICKLEPYAEFLFFSLLSAIANQTFRRLAEIFSASAAEPTRRSASADRTARRQFQATGQPVSRMQATTIFR